MKCLIVDDQPINTQVLSAQLRHFNLEVDVCFCGQDAIDLANLKPFDLIFMDINMPGLNGHQAAAAIQKNNASSCVIAVSGDPCPETLPDYFVDWLLKPISLTQLSALVEQQQNN